MSKSLVLWILWVMHVKGGIYRLAFRGCARIQSSHSLHDVWMTEPGINRQIRTSDPCTEHFKSILVDQWADLGVERVRYSMYKGNMEVAWVEFDGTMSSRENWMTRDRILDSSYNDLDTGTDIVTMSYQEGGDSKPFTNCNMDMGWMTVSDKGMPGPCQYDSYIPERPLMFYSTQSGSAMYMAETCSGMLYWEQVSSTGALCTAINQTVFADHVACAKFACAHKANIFNTGNDQCTVYSCPNPNDVPEGVSHSYKLDTTKITASADMMVIWISTKEDGGIFQNLLHSAIGIDGGTTYEPSFTDGNMTSQWDDSCRVEQCQDRPSYIVLQLPPDVSVGSVGIHIAKTNTCQNRFVNRATSVGALGVSVTARHFPFLYDDMPASSAISGMCSETAIGERAYWIVDLGRVYAVWKVSMDWHLELHPFTIRVGQHQETAGFHRNELFAEYFNETGGSVLEMVVDRAAEGRYVVIQNTESVDQSLKLCNVQVFSSHQIHTSVSNEVPQSSFNENLYMTSLCGSEYVKADNQTLTVYCKQPMKGQYLIVWTQQQDLLALCEITAYKANQYETFNKPIASNGNNVDLAGNVTFIPTSERVIPADGKITGWTLKVNTTHHPGGGEVYLQVWRQLFARTATYELVGQSLIQVSEMPGVSKWLTYDLDPGDVIQVLKGDVIGISQPGRGLITFNITDDEDCTQVLSLGSPSDHFMAIEVGNNFTFNSSYWGGREYDFYAIWRPPKDDFPWYKIRSKTKPDLCLSMAPTGLITENCSRLTETYYDDQAWFWKIDAFGRLINKKHFQCLEHSNGWRLKECFAVRDLWSLLHGVPGIDTELQYDRDGLCLAAESCPDDQCIVSLQKCGASTMSGWKTEHLVSETAFEVGCYLSEFAKVETSSPMTSKSVIYECIKACKTNNPSYPYPAIRGTKCYCEREYDWYIAVPDKICDQPCGRVDFSGKCGGNGAVTRSVYKNGYTLQMCPPVLDPTLVPRDEMCGFVGQYESHQCVFDCDVGYMFSYSLPNRAHHVINGLIATCLPSYDWDLPVGVNICIPIQCPSPQETPTSYPLTMSTNLGDTVEFRCKDGFYFYSGSLEHTCGEHGEWLKSPHFCNPITCSMETLMPNVVVVDVTLPNTNYVLNDPDSYPYRTSLTYSCQQGYDSLNPMVETICDVSGNWSYSQPMCQLVDCGQPAMGLNTLLEVPHTTYQSLARYTCKPDHSLYSGHLERYCQVDGIWNGSMPVCTEQLIDPSAIPDVPNTVKNINASHVTYTCAENFYANGTLGEMTCTTSIAIMGYCQEINCVDTVCGDPVPPMPSLFAVMAMTGRSPGDIVMYTCVPGLEGGGRTLFRQMCADGIWQDIYCNADNATDYCQEVVECGLPPSVSYATVTYSSTVYNSIAEFSCDVNAITQSSSCSENGQWSEVMIDCPAPTCPDPLSSATLNEGVTLMNISGYLPGDTANFGCEANYRVSSGNEVWFCDAEETWLGTDLICIERQCDTPYMFESTFCAMSSPQIHVGTALDCQCLPGYHRTVGDLTRVCKADEMWSGIPLECEAKMCPDVNSIDTAALIAVVEGRSPGATASFMCAEKYQLVGEGQLECTEEGSWSATLPNCTVVDCGSPPNITTATVAYNMTSLYSQAEYTCTERYIPDTVTHECDDKGHWSGPPLHCIFRQCPPPTVETFSTVSVDDAHLTVGTQATYSCQENFMVVSGDKIRICDNSGNWTGRAVQCLATTCGNPPDIVKATWEIDKYSRGRTVRYRCVPGYMVHAGQALKTCLDSGDWVGADIVCVAKKAEENFLKMLIRQEEESMTPYERYMKSMGWTEADNRESAKAIGALEVIFVIFSFLIFVIMDIPDYKREFRLRFLRNVFNIIPKEFQKQPLSPEPILPILDSNVADFPNLQLGNSESGR